MIYPEMIGTRLSPELAAHVRAYAKEFEVGESAVLRLAVKEFFKKPRRARERVRAVRQPHPTGGLYPAKRPSAGKLQPKPSD